MAFCLPKFAADDFKAKLKDGTISPEKLVGMTSAERRTFFEGIVGEDYAREVNAGFESKLLLQDQQRGMINWAKTLTGIKPEIRSDILSKVQRLDKVLQPGELDMFLEDLASKRLGVGVTAEEAGIITDLAKNIETTKAEMLPDFKFPTNEAKMAYGYAQVDFLDYIAALKEDATKRTFKEVLTDIYEKPGTNIKEIGAFSKSLIASLDDSALFNQGAKVLYSHPVVWAKNAFSSFKDVWNTFGGKAVMRDIRAEIFSRPNALNGTYAKMKLGVGITEEAFPSQLPEKIPILGRAFRAAENAFTGFQYRNRADIADMYLRTLQKMGADITDKTRLQSWGKLINSLTGRGNLGPAEPAANAFNSIFFSPRFLKSHLDVLFLHPIGGAGGDSFVRKQAAKNLLKIVAGISLILLTAYAINKTSVEFDPRSTNFGKVKVAGQWTDITGGMSFVLTLAARIGTWSSKSSATGQISTINSGKFGSTTGFDLFTNFFANKLSPLAGILRDYLKGQDPNGNKPTFLNELENLTIPIPITSYQSISLDPNKANVVGSMILQELGANVNAYAPTVSGIIAQDKPAVLEETFEKLAQGDTQGANTLVHDFNTQLKQSIHDELAKQTPDADPNVLDQQAEKKWEKDALHLPNAADVAKFKAGDKDIVAKVTASGTPVVKQNTPVSSTGIIGTVLAYAEAIGTDPITAFNDIFKGQVIREVTNGTVIVNRMSLTDSEQVKKDRGGNNTSMKLDHTLPLQLGGDNEKSNLKLVPTAVWASYTPVENYLGTALKAGRVTKTQAQSAIFSFKAGTMTFAEIEQKYPTK